MEIEVEVGVLGLLGWGGLGEFELCINMCINLLNSTQSLCLGLPHTHTDMILISKWVKQVQILK